MTKRFIVFLSQCLTLICLSPLAARSEVYRLPASGDDLIGAIRYAAAGDQDTLIDIARENSLGQDEIVMANPSVDRWLPKAGTRVLIPRQFILPDAARAGIVLNIPEMRMYYFPGAVKSSTPKPSAAKLRTSTKGGHSATHIARKGESKRTPAVKDDAVVEAPPVAVTTPAREVVTYPVSIGRMDWRTPLGQTEVIQKIKDPEWHPPESIKKEHAKDGDMLPDVVPAGPNNPLGQFAMKLGVAGYLIHGTDVDKSYGIGMRVTHGCIRMYPEDIAKLFPLVSVGTPVRLVNQPVKLGWLGGELYMEVHQPLDEDRMSFSELRDIAMELIDKKTATRPVAISRVAVQKELEHPTGVPILISGTSSVEQPVERPAQDFAGRPAAELDSAARETTPVAAPEPAPAPAAPEEPDPVLSEPSYVPESDEAEEDAEEASASAGL